MSDRRATPLARRLAGEIAAGGPIGIDKYIRRCLSDPQHGYYTTRAGIGRTGDFTTAPEISQVFGELIGLWAAVVWQQMGSPALVNIVELGPGRGTLMADALRAARILPGFLDAMTLHLCEINPAFRESQAGQLSNRTAGITPHWHSTWPDLGGEPVIVIGNEFLDTLPGCQWQLGADGIWAERCVGLGCDGHLAFATRTRAPPFEVPQLPSPGADAIFTHADFSELLGGLGRHSRRVPLAALFIDYGHTSTAFGDTLQAVRNHRFEDPLCSPGEADLSLAVDFAAFRGAAATAGLAFDGPVTQAEFLGALGIAERASKLMAANPARANDVESAIFRLMSPTGMGTRFHAVGVRSPGLPPLPGFAISPR